MAAFLRVGVIVLELLLTRLGVGHSFIAPVLHPISPFSFFCIARRSSSWVSFGYNLDNGMQLKS